MPAASVGTYYIDNDPTQPPTGEDVESNLLDMDSFQELVFHLQESVDALQNQMITLNRETIAQTFLNSKKKYTNWIRYEKLLISMIPLLVFISAGFYLLTYPEEFVDPKKLAKFTGQMFTAVGVVWGVQQIWRHVWK